MGERAQSVEIVWSLYPDWGAKAWESSNETILPSWAGIASNAEEAVSRVVSLYYDTPAWVVDLGEDEDSVTMFVEVHSPAAIAGRYEVELQRVTKARAVRCATGSEKE